MSVFKFLAENSDLIKISGVAARSGVAVGRLHLAVMRESTVKGPERNKAIFSVEEVEAIKSAIDSMWSDKK